MEYKSPLSQRIVISFVLLTTVVSGLFALGLTFTIHVVEERLISTELKQDLSRVLDDYQQGRELRLDDASAFFTAGPELPDYLRSVGTGFTEIVLQDRAYYVYRVRKGETSYFLVKDQTVFEKGEKLLKLAVSGGFVLSVLGSLLLGVFMAKTVIAPVQRLTRQVAERENLQNDSPPLFSDYADDEIGALARAFDTTIAKLEQALQREAMFTSDVSHELRTPLMVIKSSCDVLLARDGLDDYSRPKVAAISRAANEMSSLVDAFLALARGKDRPQETAPLKSVAHAEYPNWQQWAAEKESRLLLQEEASDPEQLPGSYPSTLLRTVLNNLIRNAIHHTAQGQIVLTLKPNGFELCDTGSGIAVPERPQIFKPYFSGAQSPRDGLGLGLSLVQRICEREGWTITLKENLPSGCCFRLDLG